MFAVPLRYLNETRGGGGGGDSGGDEAKPSLLPADPVARQRVRAISDIIAQGIQPVQVKLRAQ